MKKKELMKRLEATNETVEALRRDVVRSKRTTNDVVLLREEILSRQKPLKYTCPWCNEFTCDAASPLRMHEQECGSNRNRWLPQELAELLATLDVDTKAVDVQHWVAFAIERVRQLKVAAKRPVFHERTEIVKELGLDDIKGLVTVDQMIHAIKWLKHSARPICVVCGASSTDLNTMRSHMVDEHKLVCNWPPR